MNALSLPILPMQERRVSVLFVSAAGLYPFMVEDWWDESRDARNYDGPLPVVAHPPCQLWVNFAALNYSRYGGGHNRPGNDGGCFASALASVRRWGGVLEHPAESKAWPAHGLTPPGKEPGWKQTALCEWVCEVWQNAYGHAARKRTWLLYCGVVPPLEAKWDRGPGTKQVGWFDRNKPTLSKAEASSTPMCRHQAVANDRVDRLLVGCCRVLGFTVASILAIFAGTFALAALIRIIDRWHL